MAPLAPKRSVLNVGAASGLGPHGATSDARRRVNMLYETAARAQEILLLDVGDLDLANKRAMVIGKGGNAEPIGWETATARLLPRYLAGRNDGPLFLSTLAPAPSRQPAAADAEPSTGRAPQSPPFRTKRRRPGSP